MASFRQWRFDRISNLQSRFDMVMGFSKVCRVVRLVTAAVVLASVSLVFAEAPRPGAVLAEAAEAADWKAVGQLLGDGESVNRTQADGTTALHWAVHHNRPEQVRALLEAGALPDRPNRYGARPLAQACVNGNAAIVAMLIDAGADPMAKERGGETPLMLAARTGVPEVLEVLLEAGAEIDAKDGAGQTALMWASADGHVAAVDLLLEAGADPGIRVAQGFDAFLFAARNGQLGVVKRLLKAGVEPDRAIETKQGGGRNAPDGFSALRLAMENGHYELGIVLVRAGADPNERVSGMSPLHALAHIRKPDRGDGFDGQPPPRGSGAIDSLTFARELVALGAEVDSLKASGNRGKGKLDEKGATPFLLAATRADIDYMKLLMELGADPRHTTADGSDALMAAAGLGCHAPTEEAGSAPECLEVVRFLIDELGFDPNRRNENGETAVHGAAYKSLPEVIRFLAASGAEIDVWHQKNRWNWTPITIAEGFRPGNFKPSVPTLNALHELLREAGEPIPPPTPRKTGGKQEAWPADDQAPERKEKAKAAPAPPR